MLLVYSHTATLRCLLIDVILGDGYTLHDVPYKELVYAMLKVWNLQGYVMLEVVNDMLVVFGIQISSHTYWAGSVITEGFGHETSHHSSLSHPLP